MNVLQNAIIRGNAEEVAGLLANLDELDDPDILITAIHAGRIKIVKLILPKYKNIDCHDENTLDTPLMRAAWKGFTNIVKYLVEKGADINKTNRYGWTALMLAATEGREKTVQYLIEKGAKVNIIGISPAGVTALATARQFNHIGVVNLLESNGAK